MSDQMKLDTDQALTVGRAGSLANILVMTEEMLESARNDQWDDVTEMEELRRQALSECFSAPIPEEYSELFTEALAAMLDRGVFDLRALRRGVDGQASEVEVGEDRRARLLGRLDLLGGVGIGRHGRIGSLFSL